MHHRFWGFEHCGTSRFNLGHCASLIRRSRIRNWSVHVYEVVGIPCGADCHSDNLQRSKGVVERNRSSKVKERTIVTKSEFRCGWNPAIGWPAVVSTVDRFQGQQSDCKSSDPKSSCFI